MGNFRRSAGSLIVSQAAMLIAAGVVRAQVAQTPPMGWDSYDAYGGFVNEAQVEANAQYMAANLKQFGYNTIIIDFCWSYPGTGSGGTSNGQLMQSYPTTNGIISGAPTPSLSMNANGELLPDPTRFPDSIQNSTEVGFTALATYIHSLGLNFGIHIMRGIPVQAYFQNTPVAGDPGVTAQQITNAGTSDQAPWLNQMYGMDTGSNGKLTAGAQAYYNSLFDMYASWGVDYVKVDDMLSTTYHSADVAGIQQAITQSGRPMVLSLSPGPAPINQADQLGQDANMWRMLNDMWDNWGDVSSAFSAAASWNQYMGPGHWPDADMLPIGTFINPPVGSARSSALTHNQQQTVISLWSIIKSPLIMGGNLPSLASDSFTTSLLTNSSILAIDQSSLNNHQVSNASNKVVWEADVPNSASKYLALFNIGNTTTSVSTTFASLGLSATTSYDVVNLWTNADLGHFTGTFSQSLTTDTSGIYEVVNTVATTPPAWSLNGSGDWNTLGNWGTGFVPDAAGAEADFFGGITSNHTVFTDIPVTAGTLNFNNSKTYVLGGAGTLTLRTAAGSTGSAQIIVQSGSPQITLPMTIASNTTLNVSAGANLIISGALTINSGATITQTGTGTVTYETPLNLGAGSSLVIGGLVRAQSLSLAASASAQIAPDTNSVLTVDSLSIADGSTLDLSTNELAIKYGAGNASPISAVRTALHSGFNGGAWNGPGLTSTSASNNPHYALAYADGNNPADANFSGVQPNEVIVQYALSGDADLAGSVDFSDVLTVDRDYGQSIDAHGNTVDWADGDFNYDGLVNFQDLLAVAMNFDQPLTPQETAQVGSAFASQWDQALADVNSSVPEPATLGLTILGAAGLLRRRGGRQSQMI